MNAIDRMQNIYSGLAKSEKKICEYILANPQMVERATVSLISERAGSSKSAVLRFCQSLGYSGYSEFRFDLIRTLTAMESSGTIPETLAEECVEAFSRSLQTISTFDESKILEVVDAIVNAPIIRVCGLRNSSLPAMKFYHDFSLLDKNVCPLTDGLTPGLLGCVDSSDLIIIFSNSGKIMSSSIKDFLDTCRDKGCRIILVGCFGSEIRPYADLFFEIPTVNLRKDVRLDPHPMMLILIDILTAYYKRGI